MYRCHTSHNARHRRISIDLQTRFGDIFDHRGGYVDDIDIFGVQKLGGINARMRRGVCISLSR